MAGNVTGQHVFAADVGPEALSLLDGNFSPLVTAVNTLINFSNYYVDTGAVNAIVVTTTAAQVFTYTEGVMLEVKVGNTTTIVAPTINVNGLGAKTIIDFTGTALLIGALQANGRYIFIYDGTSFRCANPSAPTFYSPTLNTPTLVGDTIGRGVALCKFATSTETRTSNTTLSNSTQLLVPLVAGTYAFELWFLASQAAAAGGGIGLNVNYSGTLTQAASVLTNMTGLPGGGAVGIQALGVSTIVTTALVSSGSFATTSTIIFYIKGVLTATGPGTFASAFAQNASNANATNLLPGSYLTVTQLS